MDKKQRDFKGIWISKEIWLDERLNALEKIILAEIDSLDCEETGCYASNEYLAEFCQCSVTKVSLGIKKLIEIGYIYTASFDGRTRILKSRLSKNERQPNINLKAESQKVNAININNNIDNNKKDTFVKPSLDVIKSYCLERNNGINPNSFYDFYESKNWMIGKNKMKDWKAAIRTWEQRTTSKKEVAKPSWYDDYKKRLNEKKFYKIQEENMLDIEDAAKGLFSDE